MNKLNDQTSNSINSHSTTPSPTKSGSNLSTSPKNSSSSSSKKVTYQTENVFLSNMPKIITTKAPRSTPLPITDLLKTSNNDKKNLNLNTTTLCFICELPILSHQCWSTWPINNSPGLLTVSGVAAVATDEDFDYLQSIHHEDCLVCAICNFKLKPGSGSKRHENKVYCPLHYADVSGLGSGGEEFMNKLRDFKRQSLGCAGKFFFDFNN